MSDDSAQDKQLPASARKLQKAKEDGQVVRSKDLGHFLVVLAATGVLMGLVPVWMGHMQKLLHAGLRFDARTVASPDMMVERLSQWAIEGLLVVIPFAVGIALASVAASVLAGGWVMSFKVLQPKFSALNPLSGLGRVFSKQQLIDALKASLLGLILGTVGVMLLYKAWPRMVDLLGMPLPAAIATLGTTLAEVLGSMLLVIAAFALLDWPLQRFLFAQRMRMSHQDMKDEFKQQEGNQEVKGRIKQLMREQARKRMLAAVPTADLVVMNPTHYAVALKYDEGSMGAPRVVAKGLDLVALKIRDVATEHRVPVLEAPPLARALYANTELEQEVPVALYTAVAQVMAYVFQLRQALTGQAPMPGNLPDLDVPRELDPLQSDKAKARAAAMQAEVEA
ncbi:MAG: flagellar biosynthesis protein FlhB [Burkholderiales bacterium RIFCSPLOWO2_12_FULL_64_99]|jgi:flagellar biosynthetic protein FlhB|uniref:flagellar biosynthesis protein FlhB n=1 Tax=Aquabacterium sp. TaxID=1872578 RepID=UPI0008BE8001|nr:flagellar biosynthesis protein FlhB [Aquabacterium sp.]OGB04085.1 MAG: flagellar biosynthesis protein FlhB [Burkholderiales bacterium RIFCSPHIGHO2_12_FULL_63_20]OGB66667.1 MAG: flagellar biosynthesis protein FlhB [Burkholderiales bacterium RIFCSPLOWO2_12_FULL_64_99]